MYRHTCELIYSSQVCLCKLFVALSLPRKEDVRYDDKPVFKDRKDVTHVYIVTIAYNYALPYNHAHRAACMQINQIKTKV